MLGKNFQPGRAFVGGDSSGGGLTAATLLELRNDGGPLPGGGLMISPWVDLACTGESLDTRANVDLTVTRSSLERMAGQYLHGADPRTPLASPLYGDLSGLPPLLMTVGGDEALLDDSVRFLPEANAAVAMIGAWMRRVLS